MKHTMDDKTGFELEGEEICDKCGRNCAVTYYVKGPVKPSLVCIECRPSRNKKVAEPLRSIINSFSERC